MRQLFQDFHFPAFEAPEDFFAAQSPRRNWCARWWPLIRKGHQGLLDRPPGRLDLWGMSVSSTDILAGFADVLLELGSRAGRFPSWWPFRRHAARNSPLFQHRRATSPERGAEIRRVLKQRLPDLRPMRLTRWRGIFLHGPHFGDRYGIAQTLVDSMKRPMSPCWP